MVDEKSPVPPAGQPDEPPASRIGHFLKLKYDEYRANSADAAPAPARAEKPEPIANIIARLPWLQDPRERFKNNHASATQSGDHEPEMIKDKPKRSRGIDMDRR